MGPTRDSGCGDGTREGGGALGSFWRVSLVPVRRILKGMGVATWPVPPGLRLDCVRDGCGAEAVLHSATGDPTSDAMLCAPHAVAEGRVADRGCCPGGGVRLGVHSAPGESCATRITLSPAQVRDPAPPALTLDVAAVDIQGSAVTYRDANDADIVTVRGDTIQIHHPDTADWWQVRPATPLPLGEIVQAPPARRIPRGVEL